MTRITGISVRHDRQVYILEISWDDDAFVGGEIAFAAEVSIVNVETGISEQRHRASVHLERVADNQPPYVVVKIGDRELYRQNLSDLIGEDTFLDGIPRELFGMGDPIIGCLLRAGIAACVSQLLDCKDRTAGLDWLRPRMKAIGSCLKDHCGKIPARALTRAGMCILFS